MHLQAWYRNTQWLDFKDEDWQMGYCSRMESNPHFMDESEDFNVMICLKGTLILYGRHKANAIETVVSTQDCDLAIFSFQLGGNIDVRERNFAPYRLFPNDVHTTFFTNKRELVFNAPPVFESFRIYLSPYKFLELLAKFHGRFSEYADKVKRSEYFNLFSKELPITPRMKVIIRDILSHVIHDEMLSGVYFETKITELFGCQLEQSIETESKDSASPIEKRKWVEVKQILEENFVNPPSLGQLAKLVGTNEGKLKAGFKAQYGHSVYNYLLNYRMEKAVEWMRDPAKNLEEIAMLVGYTEGAHFNRAFKKVHGISPGKFRAELF